MSFEKQNLANGTAGDASQINHAETQYDAAVTDLAAGSIPVASSALTGTINQARFPNVVKPIFLSAGGGTPSTTSGCAPAAKLELPTNDVMVVHEAFDPTNQEFSQWTFVLPDGYNWGSLIPRFYWTAGGGTAGQTVVWGIQGRSFGDGEALDAAFGTAVEVTDALQAANALHIITGSAVTLGGTPAGGELCIIRVYRKQGTLSVDGRLLGVYLTYTGAVSD